MRETDPTDLGMPPGWGVDEPGTPIPPNDHQRAVALERMAAALGWPGSSDSRAQDRRSLLNACPRESCAAPALTQCRRRHRGSWRVLATTHDERAAAAGAAPEPSSGVPEPRRPGS